MGLKHFKSYLFLICMTMWLTITFSCETLHEFSYSTCKFQISYQDPDCFNFQFIQCSWTPPSDELSSSLESDLSNEIVETDWNKCTQQCCDYTWTYAKNTDTIGLCQNYLTTVFAMGITAACGIAVIMISWILVGCFSKNRGTCCVRNNERGRGNVSDEIMIGIY